MIFLIVLQHQRRMLIKNVQIPEDEENSTQAQVFILDDLLDLFAAAEKNVNKSKESVSSVENIAPAFV